MELKAQIEAMQAQLEQARAAELEAECVDMKKRIAAFGIRPEQLFSADDLRGHAPRRGPRRKLPDTGHAYTHGGRYWNGKGTTPQWFRDALAAGTPRESMQVSATNPAPENRPGPRGNGA